MPRIPRKLLIDPTEVGVFHCISRCVRRAFLCGHDRLTGKSFEHRRQWIQNRLAFLAGRFGIDVLGFAVMSNHVHVIIRNRPDVVAGWSAVEIARRWWELFPLRRDDNGAPAEPTDGEISMITGNPARFAEVRARLSSVSWFMRCLAEPIARWANREDGCTGRFWEGRYKCQPILDESALAACLAYVDLNPIRAGEAETPEASRYTSVYERLAATREVTQVETPVQAVDPPAAADLRATERGGRSRGAGAGVNNRSRGTWLSPFELSTPTEDVQPAPTSRDSSRGCLPMSFTDYLRLLDWTGRQVRADKRGATPSDLAPILERLQLDGDRWLDLVRDFRRLFRRAAGRPPSLRREAEKWGRQRPVGITNSAALFGTA